MREKLHEHLCAIEYVEKDDRTKMYEEIFIPFLEKLQKQNSIFFRGVASVFYSEILDAKATVAAERGKEKTE